MNFWKLTLFAVHKTPELAKELFDELEPDEWDMYFHGEPIDAPDHSFDVIGSLKNRMLKMDSVFFTNSLDGKQAHTMVAMSRFKNDGTDTLEIDEVKMTGVNFKFHSKPLRKHFRVVMRYVDQHNVPRVIEFVTKNK